MRFSFYNGQSKEVQDEAAALLKPQSIMVFDTKTTYAGWRYVPVKYVFGENDHASPRNWIDAFINPARGFFDLEVFKCDGDHSLFLDRPEWLAEVVRKAAGEALELKED